MSIKPEIALIMMLSLSIIKFSILDDGYVSDREVLLTTMLTVTGVVGIVAFINPKGNEVTLNVLLLSVT